jgi:hypothetical protein
MGNDEGDSVKGSFKSHAMASVLWVTSVEAAKNFLNLIRLRLFKLQPSINEHDFNT